MSKLAFFFDRLFGIRRRHKGQLLLPVNGGSEFVFGVTRAGIKSELAKKIDSTGARPGEAVAVDENGDARVVGRKPEIVATNEGERAKNKLMQMLEIGVTEFKWMHSGVELPCNGEDHSKLDGKKYQIAAYLKSGKPLPGGVKGCRCTPAAVIRGFD